MSLILCVAVHKVRKACSYKVNVVHTYGHVVYPVFASFCGLFKDLFARLLIIKWEFLLGEFTVLSVLNTQHCDA